MSQDLSADTPALPVTAYALLGLLTFGDELTGYELKQRADNTLRFYWVAPAMSQIYSELSRLTEHGYVEAATTQGVARRTTTYRITSAGERALHEWIDESRPERITEMLEEYVAELADALTDLRHVRESLRGADEPGQPFHYPSVVADWGLDYFAAETRHTKRALARLASEGTT
jgi:DNA-binding PadR family transcriptional regulator